MDFWELVPEIDGVFVSIVFKVVPQSVVKGNRVGFLSFRRGEDKEVVSLSVMWVSRGYACDAGVFRLRGIWFKVCDLAFVKPMCGFCFLSFV